MIELRHVHRSVQLTVIDAVNWHGIGTDGSSGILLQNLGLHMDEPNVVLALRNIPFHLDVRIMPSVEGNGNVLDVIVGLAKQIQIPGTVDLFHASVFLGKMGVKSILTVLAGASGFPRIDLVIDLPANDGRIVTELFCKLFYDDSGIT